MFWALLCPIQVLFQVQVGPKMGILGVDFFCSKWHPVILAVLKPINTHFWLTWTWNSTWMGHKSAQNIFPYCLGCVLVHYPVSRLVFLLNMASCHFGCFLPPKPPIFGPTWTWSDTWMGHKSVWQISSHCLGCVLALFPVSRWITGLIWQPTAVVLFDPKNGCF